jgi:chemotaxis signal transduction protein
VCNKIEENERRKERILHDVRVRKEIMQTEERKGEIKKVGMKVQRIKDITNYNIKQIEERKKKGKKTRQVT